MQLNFEHTYTRHIRYGARARVQCLGESMRACWLVARLRTNYRRSGHGGPGIDGSMLATRLRTGPHTPHRTEGPGGAAAWGSMVMLARLCTCIPLYAAMAASLERVGRSGRSWSRGACMGGLMGSELEAKGSKGPGYLSSSKFRVHVHDGMKACYL